MLYKENQDLKTKIQNLRNYFDRQELISHNKKVMRNFPNRPDKRKRRYQKSYESSSYEGADNEKTHYVCPKKKN